MDPVSSRRDDHGHDHDQGSSSSATSEQQQLLLEVQLDRATEEEMRRMSSRGSLAGESVVSDLDGDNWFRKLGRRWKLIVRVLVALTGVTVLSMNGVESWGMWDQTNASEWTIIVVVALLSWPLWRAVVLRLFSVAKRGVIEGELNRVGFLSLYIDQKTANLLSTISIFATWGLCYRGAYLWFVQPLLIVAVTAQGFSLLITSAVRLFEASFQVEQFMESMQQAMFVENVLATMVRGRNVGNSMHATASFIDMMSTLKTYKLRAGSNGLDVSSSHEANELGAKIFNQHCRRRHNTRRIAGTRHAASSSSSTPAKSNAPSTAAPAVLVEAGEGTRDGGSSDSQSRESDEMRRTLPRAVFDRLFEEDEVSDPVTKAVDAGPGEAANNQAVTSVADRAFALFDLHKDGVVTKQVCCDAVVAMYRQRRNLALTLANHDGIFLGLERVLHGFSLLPMVFISALVFGQDATATTVAFSSLLLSGTFVFGNMLSTLFEDLVFILLTRPFVVGDRVHLELLPHAIVHRISLQTTELRAWDGRQLRFTNRALRNMMLVNGNDGGKIVFLTTMQVAAQTTSMQFHQIEPRLQEWTNANPRDFEPGTRAKVVISLMSGTRAEILVIVTGTMTWQEPGRRSDIQTRVQLKLLQIFRDLGIRLWTEQRVVAMSEGPERPQVIGRIQFDAVQEAQHSVSQDGRVVTLGAAHESLIAWEPVM